jgi:hypothetical protein
MQNPRGNNDRLNEATADRQNAQRLFDSENNARGGYSWGPALTYYEGSVLSVEWTSQHSCGIDNTGCNVVFQYMCSDSAPGADERFIIRDGTTTTTIPTTTTPTAGDYYNKKDATTGEFVYGMNEPISVYQACVARDRNKGLFVGEETVTNNQGAMATRQNAGATRHGFECSEDRDYWPYWHPSPWKDIAVLVNQKSECKALTAESQNVKAKNFCNGTTTAQKAANNEADCVRATGKWVATPAFGIAAPECIEAPANRDNHLGNGIDGFTNSYNWTLPRTADEACIENGNCSCVLRMRYNITLGELDGTEDSLVSGANSPVQDDPTVGVEGQNFTLAIDTAQTGRGFQDRSFTFHIAPRPDGVAADVKIYNLNVRGKRGNIVQVYPATEYDFVPTNLEVKTDDYVHFQWTGSDTNPANNQGEGKVQTDRSNIVQIADMSKNYPLNATELAKTDLLFKDDAIRARMANIDQVNCLSYAALKATANAGGAAVDQNNQNCMVLNQAGPRFSGGLVRMTTNGEYYYMSTRNNNFSNRSHKASIKVSGGWPVWKTAVIVVAGAVAVAIGAAAGTVIYAKRNPHSKAADFVSKIPGINKI